MVAAVKYQLATEKMVEAGNMGSDTWQFILSNTAPNVATDTTAASATELGTAGGYTAGGNNCAVSSSVSTGGVYKLTLADPTAWTGSGAGFTFRYGILYNLTQTQCWQYYDYGSSQLVAAGETLTADLSAANGVFTVT
jgi:hypothetical protein